MEQKFFLPLKTLQLILQSLGFPEELQKKVMSDFQVLLSQRITLALLKKLENKEGLNEMINSLYVSASDEIEVEKNLEQIVKFCGKTLSDQEKEDIYFVPMFSTFLDSVSSLSENSTDEEKIKIKEILEDDEEFQEIFKAWEESQKLAAKR